MALDVRANIKTAASKVAQIMFVQGIPHSPHFFTGFCYVRRRNNARKEEKEMYEMANQSRVEDKAAGRAGNRADKPVSFPC